MKPMLLCILDGVGIRDEIYGNAVKQAKMPYFNHLLKTYPNTLLKASELAVGLPKGQMGNSEVGHLTIGSGRVFYQPLEKINQDIKNGIFKNNEVIKNLIKSTENKQTDLHIMGLLSDGGVHSHINHLWAIIDMLKTYQGQIYFHCFLDGRDTSPKSSISYLEQLENKIGVLPKAKIATISGRYYAMDRDNRWDRIKKAYDVIVCEEGKIISNYQQYIKDSYKNGITDEFLMPVCLTEGASIKSGDSIFVFNFRPDRLRELFTSITNSTFDKFEQKKLKEIELVTMMPVSNTVICKNVYNDPKLTNTFGEYISNHNLTQLRIAETEKYAHVTYFFDGGVEKKLKGCNRILIPSSKVATYDLKPEMSAKEITNTLIEEIDKNIHDVIILNFANGDMVGHTGNFEAVKNALETLDSCLEKIAKKIIQKDGILLVTADHGNSDTMLDKNGNIITSHSLSEVPFIVVNHPCQLKKGTLADIAPTMLFLLGIDIPEEMTGKNLVKGEENK